MMNQYEALLQQSEKLQRQVDDHRRLLQEIDCACRKNLDFCPRLQCPHERQLKDAVKDVVETLDQTRTSFKSKQLEKLRKRMLKVLHSTPV